LWAWERQNRAHNPPVQEIRNEVKPADRELLRPLLLPAAAEPPRERHDGCSTHALQVGKLALSVWAGGGVG
jgi:hypothetical protein